MIESFLALAFLYGQSGDPIGWIYGKWKPDPPAYVSYQEQVIKLWSEDVLDERKLDEFLRSAVREFQTTKTQLSFTKLLILEAHFPDRALRHAVDVQYEIGRTKVFPCYITARAVFRIVGRSGFGGTGDWSMVDRFLAKWPQDPFIKSLFIYEYGDELAKVKPLSVLTKYVKEMQRDFPQKDERLLHSYCWAEFAIFQRTKDQAALKRGIAYCEQLLRHPQARKIDRDIMTNMLKIYRPKLKSKQ